ncbi:hypothetical protein WN50_36520 [Limnoraphis robusta CS-951]|uniref:Uncharacterized protein n=1 Tax=Limnoraphis robusta CS-951 TaxID=1637645 RepID=A0A0J9EVI3_9CYAN|nr:hypothetical protein WN50_36520 [Limnoraphis robusta CS-951]
MANHHGAAAAIIDAEIVHRPVRKGTFRDILAQNLDHAFVAIINQNAIKDLAHLVISTLKSLHEVTAIMRQKAGEIPFMIV